MECGDCHSLLDIVVGDALEGVDIIERYPRLYARMLAAEALHRHFLDALALREEMEGAAGEGESRAPVITR